MTETGDTTRSLPTDVLDLQRQVEHLRRTVLRAACLVALALIVLGALMPAWRATVDGHPTTMRVATAGVQAMTQSTGEDDSFNRLATVGFLGLVVVLVLLAGVLVVSVMQGLGRSRNGWARHTLVALCLVGVVVPLLFSLIASSSDEAGSGGGWGPLVLALGLVAAAWILASPGWRDLWLDRGARTGS